jgi:hypothetical protein
VVHQVAHRSRQVAGGRLIALAADALGLPLGGGGQQPLLAQDPLAGGRGRLGPACIR